MQPAEVDKALGLSPSEAITQLGAISEDQWFERKSGRIRPKDLATALVGLANAEGGTVFVGYHDGKLDPVLATKLNEMRQTAVQLTSPPVRARVTEIPLEGRSDAVCLVFRVDPGELVHETTSSDCYVRIGDSTRKLTFAQRQELQFDRGSPPFDGTEANAAPADLDARQTAAYQEAIGASSVTKMLKARNLLTRKGEITVAGYLLFAEQPQAQFPNAYVRVLKYGDVQRGTGSRLTLVDDGDVACGGSIPHQIQRASEVIEALLPKRRGLTSSGRFEGVPIIPTDAWLEGLVNAVVHRSYSLSGDHVRVEIFPDRIEITSPGRFPGLVDPSQPMSISRHARNPRIARVCADLGIAQELGEGIRRMFDEMRRRGLTDPLYKQSAAAVQLVLSSADAVPDELRRSLPRSASAVLDVLRRADRPLGTGQIAELAGIARLTATRSLQRLRDVELVEWQGDSPKDPRATWQLL